MSFAPVNAMSGSTPLRLGSMLSVGSPVADEPPSFASRSRPTCCQQNAATEAASDGLKPLQAWLQRRLLDALGDEDLVVVAGAVDVAVLLLPRHPRHRVVAGHRGAAGDRRVLGLLVGVDVQRRDAASRDPGPRAASGSPARRSGSRRSASHHRAERSARTTHPTGRCGPRRRSRSTAPRPRRSDRC